MNWEFYLLDILFTLLHLLVIGFNLLGWIWQRTLKWHFVSICLTFLSWFGMGIWYGWGYCFLTDWHWDIKRQRGVSNLPGSFIEYALEYVLPIDFSASLVSVFTLVVFLVVAFLSVYKLFLIKR